jgi:hypothetical protein
VNCTISPGEETERTKISLAIELIYIFTGSLLTDLGSTIFFGPQGLHGLVVGTMCNKLIQPCMVCR